MKGSLFYENEMQILHHQIDMLGAPLAKVFRLRDFSEKG